MTNLPEPADQTALRDRIADKLTADAYECDGKCGLSERECYDAHPITFSAMAGGTTHVDGSVTAIADAVLAVLPAPADRAAVLREAADRVDNEELPHDYVDMFDNGARWAARLLRRMADETATETPQRERVKHSGPDTKFCVLCLSGEHERVDESDAEADTDAVLAVLYREWPWLRAEAENAGTATDHTTPPAWVDGHPQLEAIATAVWEQCGRSDNGACVDDDPRNIAVAALSAVRNTADDQAAENKRLRAKVFEWQGSYLDEVKVRQERDAEIARLRADRAAVLRWAADRYDRSDRIVTQMFGHQVAAELRRLADETPDTTTAAAVDLPTLAAALDGLHTLIATSSRDWQTYRVDAWIWAVLCGWDCEDTDHTETCVHGALEETAARHGWDEATVAKARRYRAAVRAVTETLPAAGARQDGAPADPWSIKYHRLSPTASNPTICICGLGPDALVHNEPQHECSSRPTAPHQIPIAGLCTLCHHHESAACHTTAAARQDGGAQ